MKNLGIGSEIEYSGRKIGKVTAFNLYDGGYSDCTFVELYPGIEPTNDVMGGYHLTDYSTTIIEGATIKVAGMKTGYVQTGTILDAHRDGTSSGRKYTDFFKVFVQVIGGDSGSQFGILHQVIKMER